MAAWPYPGRPTQRTPTRRASPVGSTRSFPMWRRAGVSTVSCSAGPSGRVRAALGGRVGTPSRGARRRPHTQAGRPDAHRVDGVLRDPGRRRARGPDPGGGRAGDHRAHPAGPLRYDRPRDRPRGWGLRPVAGGHPSRFRRAARAGLLLLGRAVRAGPGNRRPFLRHPVPRSPVRPRRLARLRPRPGLWRLPGRDAAALPRPLRSGGRRRGSRYGEPARRTRPGTPFDTSYGRAAVVTDNQGRRSPYSRYGAGDFVPRHPVSPRVRNLWRGQEESGCVPPWRCGGETLHGAAFIRG